MAAPEPLPLTDALRDVELLTIPQVAALWKCSRSTVYAAIARGALRTVRLVDERRVPRTELEAFIARQLAPTPLSASSPAALAAVGAPRRTRRSGPA